MCHLDFSCYVKWRVKIYYVVLRVGVCSAIHIRNSWAWLRLEFCAALCLASLLCAPCNSAAHIECITLETNETLLHTSISFQFILCRALSCWYIIPPPPSVHSHPLAWNIRLTSNRNHCYRSQINGFVRLRSESRFQAEEKLRCMRLCLANVIQATDMRVNPVYRRRTAPVHTMLAIFHFVSDDGQMAIYNPYMMATNVEKKVNES